MSFIDGWKKRYKSEVKETKEIGTLTLYQPLYYRESAGKTMYIGFNGIPIELELAPEDGLTALYAAIENRAPHTVNRAIVATQVQKLAPVENLELDTGFTDMMEGIKEKITEVMSIPAEKLEPKVRIDDSVIQKAVAVALESTSVEVTPEQEQKIAEAIGGAVTAESVPLEELDKHPKLAESVKAAVEEVTAKITPVTDSFAVSQDILTTHSSQEDIDKVYNSPIFENAVGVVAELEALPAPADESKASLAKKARKKPAKDTESSDA